MRATDEPSEIKAIEDEVEAEFGGGATSLWTEDDLDKKAIATAGDEPPEDELLVSMRRKEFPWSSREVFRANETGRILMTVDPGMKIQYDDEGDYRIIYTARVLVRRMEWYYRLTAYNQRDRVLLSVTHQRVTHDRGDVYISIPGRSSRIEHHFAAIHKWKRYGNGRFWD